MEDFIESITNWNKFDANIDVVKRLNGVTLDLLTTEVSIWNKQLHMIDPFDYPSVKKEIDVWDFYVPGNIAYSSPGAIGEIMARFIAYKARLSYLMPIIKKWKDTCENAIDYIESLAPGAFSGTGPEKKANASHIVQPFVHLRNEICGAEQYIMHIDKCVMYCSQQLDLMVKERQSRAKQNYKLSNIIDEPSFEEEEITIEEDGDIFKTVKNIDKKR